MTRIHPEQLAPQGASPRITHNCRPITRFAINIGNERDHVAESACLRLIEQPFALGADSELDGYRSPVPLCADEICLDRSSLPAIIGRYQYINIKLDKSGGLTEAIELARSAEHAGLGIMWSLACVVRMGRCTHPRRNCRGQ